MFLLSFLGFLKNPKVLLAIAIVVALALFYSYAHSNGYEKAKVKYEAQITKMVTDQKTELDNANAKVEGLTLTLSKLSTNFEIKYTKELQDANQKIAELKGRATRGGSSFSLGGKCSGPAIRLPNQPVFASGGTQSSSVAEPAAVPVGEGRCELDPAVGIALVDIAAEGDRAKRKVNYLIDFYTSIQKAGGCNAKDFQEVEKIKVSADEGLILQASLTLAMK